MDYVRGGDASKSCAEANDFLSEFNSLDVVYSRSRPTVLVNGKPWKRIITRKSVIAGGRVGGGVAILIVGREKGLARGWISFSVLDSDHREVCTDFREFQGVYERP